MKKPKHTLTSIALIIGSANNVQGAIQKTANIFEGKKTALIYTENHRRSRDAVTGIPTYPLNTLFPNITDVKNIHAGPIANFAKEHEIENIIICTEGITNLGLVESLAYNVTGNNWQPFVVHQHHPAGGHVYNLREQKYEKI